MSYLLAALALLTAAAVAAMLFKRSGSRGGTPAAAPARRAAPAPGAAAAPARQPTLAGAGTKADPVVAVAAAPAEPVAALASYRPQRAAELPPERRKSYVDTFREVPRPPKLLRHLMSPEFLEAANSAQLVELISAEPLIAAKVLTAVNSPLYGLKSPVTSVGQAVTYLGLNTVRTLCLQYILISAFKADSPERQQVLDATWRASALASELTHQLCYRLGMAEPGFTVSAVVLSFLGRLATAATMPRALLPQIPARDLLARAEAEQQRMGLPASEIGRLLMTEWGLPERLVAEAADIDTVLSTPAQGLDPARAPRLALAYLCARLGERLAVGEVPDLLTFDLAATADAELHHFRGHLSDARLAKLTEHVRAPALSAELQRMIAFWKR
ncbi:MAG: HDOD domain-containing protein [Rubrivivax sp.]|nr:HDOD domain-containing protein [Rubrivivax sp.]